jgi:hypothetical protein
MLPPLLPAPKRLAARRIEVATSAIVCFGSGKVKRFELGEEVAR